ncbi:InlB B-repeat-containing protein, partial [Desulfatiferula olefinivorans]
KTYNVSLTLAANTGSLARTGHSFAGWNTATDGTGTHYESGGTYTGNAALTLYAEWTIDTYAVTYNTNGATSGSAPDAQTKTYNVSLTLAANTGSLARTGHTFAGWNTATDGTGTHYESGGTYTGNAALTLYAEWTIDTYAVT